MSLLRTAALVAALSLFGTLATVQADASPNLNLEENVEALANAGDPVVQIATGEDHACALLQLGYVYCWGANSSGQLGIGTRDLG